MRGRAGFTLIELLVVIAIIGVLVGILLPSLARARGNARLAVCSSNLRQWGTAVRLYADTNDGFLPRRGQGVNPTQQIDRDADWFNALPVVMGQASYYALANSGRVPRPGDHSFFSCPEADDSGNAIFFSYGMNMWLSVWNGNDPPAMFNRVGEPATLVFLADGPADYCSVSPATPQFEYSPAPRHGRRVNVCFLDGHVDLFDGAYLGCGIGFREYADLRWRVPGSTWASAQH